MLNKRILLVYLIVIGVGLTLLQFYFLRMQKLNSEKIQVVVSTVLKFEKISQNPYTLSETLQTLESTNLIKCTILKKENDSAIYFNTIKNNDCEISKFSVDGESVKLSLKSINGINWLIITKTINPYSFNEMVLSSRVFLIVILTGIFFIIILFIKNKNLKLEMLNQESLVYQQVNHDIQSPLFVLKTIIMKNEISSDGLEILKAALKRLDMILYDTRTKSNMQNVETFENFDLNSSLEEIISEKKLIYKNIEINLEAEKSFSYCLNSNKTLFQRVLSNLLNNSIEASQANESNSVFLNIFEQDGLLKIKVADNGKGFPESVLRKAGKEKVTEGKEGHPISGSGLGLYHAFNSLKKLNMEIALGNTEIGAVVEITVNQFDKVEKSLCYDYVYIEDDQMLCFLWKEKAKKSNIKLKVLNHPNQFSQVQNEINESTKIYSDSSFKDAKGEDLLSELYDLGFRNLYLTTGYSAENFHDQSKFEVIGKTIPF